MYFANLLRRCWVSLLTQGKTAEIESAQACKIIRHWKTGHLIELNACWHSVAASAAHRRKPLDVS